MTDSPVTLTDGSGVVRFEGTQSPGGGSMPGAAVVRGPFRFAFNTPGLAAGVVLYTPAAGEILLDAWIAVDTDEPFDGTTPHADIGTFVGGGSGLFNNVTGAVDLTAGDSDANGLAIGPGGNIQNDLALSGVQAGGMGTWRLVPARFTGTETLKLVASQDGSSGGTPLDSTSGAGSVYIVTATPVALP